MSLMKDGFPSIILFTVGIKSPKVIPSKQEPKNPKKIGSIIKIGFILALVKNSLRSLKKRKTLLFICSYKNNMPLDL